MRAELTNVQYWDLIEYHNRVGGIGPDRMDEYHAMQISCWSKIPVEKLMRVKARVQPDSPEVIMQKILKFNPPPTT